MASSELGVKRTGNGGGRSGKGTASLSIEERTVADGGVYAGKVRVPRELMRRLGIQEGQTVRVVNGERATLLSVTAGPAPWAESNPEDLNGIGARSGAMLSYVVDRTS